MLVPVALVAVHHSPRFGLSGNEALWFSLRVFEL